MMHVFFYCVIPSKVVITSFYSFLVNTAYYYPSDPNTFYAPPYNQASAPPMEPEDKKNL